MDDLEYLAEINKEPGSERYWKFWDKLLELWYLSESPNAPVPPPAELRAQHQSLLFGYRDGDYERAFMASGSLTGSSPSIER